MWRSWAYNATDHGEPMAGNYSPVTTAISIRDQRAQMTVLTDRAQAGSGSVHDGEIELLVHRRLLKDDGRGVGEPLNETEAISPYAGKDQARPLGLGLVVRGQHFLMLAPPAKAAAAWRQQMDHVYQPPTPIFLPGTRARLAAHFSATELALPANVQLVSLEPVAEHKVLVRLAHQFGLGEDAELSRPVTIDVARLFAGRRIATLEERGLTGTVPRAEVLQRRIAWPVEGEPSPKVPGAEGRSGNTPMQVTLGPLQIRTFHVELTPPEVHV
mmetsp:Transcript_4107/g.13171  ORF Transcript_4107/g.13171 Transcript_4107/m.13171 type:complete len:271 (+) Transcript_4107:255-1067(+)